MSAAGGAGLHRSKTPVRGMLMRGDFHRGPTMLKKKNNLASALAAGLVLFVLGCLIVFLVATLIR